MAFLDFHLVGLVLGHRPYHILGDEIFLVAIFVNEPSFHQCFYGFPVFERLQEAYPQLYSDVFNRHWPLCTPVTKDGEYNRLIDAKSQFLHDIFQLVVRVGIQAVQRVFQVIMHAGLHQFFHRPNQREVASPVGVLWRFLYLEACSVVVFGIVCFTHDIQFLLFLK